VLEDADRRLFVSEEASRAFNKSQTYSHKGRRFDPVDRQALGVVRLLLAKNVAYNIVNEKTTYGLFKALSNMYEKPSPLNKVFLIRQLMNTKMKEGAFVADHVNEFNLILSRLMSIDIKFDDEVQALLLLSLLPESWSGTLTIVSGSTGTTKLKFDNIRDLILTEDIHGKTSGKGNVPLWHQRLGNMSENGIKILASKGRIPDLQKVVVGFCEPCVLGKQKKNNVAERMNRTLNERAKSMRLHAGLPKMFWEDLVTTTAYLINQRHSLPLGFRILEEEWQGKEVSLAHLKLFGCDSYIKVKDVARDKLDAKDDTFNEDSLYGAKAATTSCNLTKPYRKDQVVKKTLKMMHSSRKEALRLHRPDIVHAVGVISRFMSNPGRKHWEAVLLRYLKGTSKATLCFSRKEVVLEGFSDSDYEGCLDSGMSTTSYVFIVGGTVVSWMPRIQKCVAMSTTEAVCMAIIEAGKEMA
nr:retrovirus-related Pol polyprotein from transposon TNT 1-94 [Tanacetum cinerariifolium]